MARDLQSVNQTEIEEFILERFCFIENHDFEPVHIERERHATKFRYFDAEKVIAIEIVFEIRELIVSVFLVRLVDGQLPKGYYRDDTSGCRLYLQEVVRDLGSNVSNEEWNRLQPSRKRQRGRRTVTTPSLKLRIRDLSTVLEDIIMNVTSVRNALFRE